MKPREPYWAFNPDWMPENTAFHEAMHAAAAWLLGCVPERIVVRKDYTGYCRTVHPGIWLNSWKMVALFLAPALVGDLSEDDKEFIAGRGNYMRGVAWRWLKKNRRSLLLRARKIEKQIGSRNSTIITFRDDATVKNWRRTTRKTGDYRC